MPQVATVEREQHQRSANAPLPTDTSNLDALFAEFCQSDFARTMCTYCNLNPTDYGKVSGMFESIELVGTQLRVKLRRPFEQRTEKILDRLAKHLRGQTGGAIKTLQYKQDTVVGTKIIG